MFEDFKYNNILINDKIEEKLINKNIEKINIYEDKNIFIDYMKTDSFADLFRKRESKRKDVVPVSSFAPAPITTPLPIVGWRFPCSFPVPPRVTP